MHAIARARFYACTLTSVVEDLNDMFMPWLDVEGIVYHARRPLRRERKKALRYSIDIRIRMPIKIYVFCRRWAEHMLRLSPVLLLNRLYPLLAGLIGELTGELVGIWSRNSEHD